MRNRKCIEHLFVQKFLHDKNSTFVDYSAKQNFHEGEGRVWNLWTMDGVLKPEKYLYVIYEQPLSIILVG